MTDFLLRLPQRFLMLLILIYRYSLASIMGQRCRFAPSCSEYGLEAVRRHGAVKGGWLAARTWHIGKAAVRSITTRRRYKPFPEPGPMQGAEA